MKSERKKTSIPNTVLLIVLTLIVAIPFIIMLVGAFKPSISLIQMPIDLNPFQNLTFSNIVKVFKKSDILLWMKNSFFISIATALITAIISMTAGYAFARIKFRGSGVLFVCVIATMMVPKQILLIPNYLVAYTLSLQNTLIGVILTSVAPAFGIFLSRQMIRSLPQELFDAADIDGCNELQKFLRIVIPVSLPAAGTIMIFSFFEVFNDYLWQLIMISDKAIKTLPVGISMYAEKLQGNRGVQLALALMATIPLAVVFIVFQRFFIKENTAGAVKG